MDRLKEKIREMVVKQMKDMGECSSTGGSGISGSPGAEIATPNAFKKKSKIVRRNFVNEHKYRLALFEDVINNVTFGMKLSDQAKELMDFIRGSQAHASELSQINDLLKGMGQAGEADKSKAFQLYQEFIQNSARDFVRANASDMKPEEYFLQKDLLQLTYYFTQKFETPMTGGQDAIDKVPGEQPQDAPPPEGGDGGDGGDGGGSSASAGLDLGDEAGAEGGEADTGAEAEAGGEGETEEENPTGGPPKPENVKEVEKKQIMAQNTDQNFQDDLEQARQLVIKLAKQCIQNGNRGVANQLVQLAKAYDTINEGKRK